MIKVKHNLIDIRNRTITPSLIKIKGGKIHAIEKIDEKLDTFVLPGFVDAHVHIESSMLLPTEFAKLAVKHGTVATVSDPHEIANVNGIKGVEYMLKNAAKVPFKFNFGAPSCVPATSFETAGDEIDVKGIKQLLARDDIKYLAEMMNYPGVLHKDPMVMDKIQAAIDVQKPIDGHAPGLRGKDALQYIDAGISTDHECFTLEEALEKLKYGMSIIIREGSAAKNFNALHSIISTSPKSVMFCSDDKHPDDLIEGHINLLVNRALKEGHDLFDVLEAACITPVTHYHLDVGTLQQHDPADFIVVPSTGSFFPIETWINGELVMKNGETLFSTRKEHPLNNFNISTIDKSELSIPATSKIVNVIGVQDGELITKAITGSPKIEQGNWTSNIDEDILKIVVVNRYKKSPVSVGFAKNFGLQKGAIASSVAHDSHNIIAVGVSDKLITKAINGVIEEKGGLSYADENGIDTLGLPVAGLMSNLPGIKVAKQYQQLVQKSREAGSSLHSPYMTLSFMALLVIPNVKLSDKGLFDAKKFEFIQLGVA